MIKNIFKSDRFYYAFLVVLFGIVLKFPSPKTPKMKIMLFHTGEIDIDADHTGEITLGSKHDFWVGRN